MISFERIEVETFFDHTSFSLAFSPQSVLKSNHYTMDMGDLILMLDLHYFQTKSDIVKTYQ